jgi:1-acyl-sn-glycerol-3-phosphate acyltransferase
MVVWILPFGIIGVPLIYLIRGNSSRILTRLWTNGVFFALKYLCGITYELRGVENIPKSGAIIACKHQSAWETMMFNVILDKPACIFKKELRKIPIFGWYLESLGMIAIDRSAGIRAIKDMIIQTKERLEQNYVVIVFPEGTRTNIGDTRKYQSGIVALYSSKNIDADIVPVAINAGLYWQKDTFIKKSGKIIVEFLPAIDKNLPKNDFTTQLQEIIDGKSQQLVDEALNIKSQA